ncbi:MAG: M48 family metalloprotease, partial [Candidatus Bathyarchaeota archaeon]|nr:M48 family metalloprotease [Candidatus Bathyarchaeota archaeon]
AAIIGMVLLAFSLFLNLICVRFLSRTREYYADRHSASTVEEGPRKLSEGLVKIVHMTKNMKYIKKQTQNMYAFKALFIADPDHAETDSMTISTVAAASDQKLVQEYLSKELTLADRIAEIFSTHPNIIKRLRALQELS